MYYQNYEDYMRSILGYSVNDNYNMNNYSNMQYENYSYNTPRYSSEILELYPEIYKIINPMVCKICDANTKPITKELIDKMTEEIYLNIESDPYIFESDTVNVRVNLPKKDNQEQIKNETNRKNVVSQTSSGTKTREIKQEKSSNNIKESRQENSENRQRQRNSILRDLIRILILNRLLGGNFRPPRPNPPRPPFPGGGPRPNPPRPNPRPPIEPRSAYGSF